MPCQALRNVPRAKLDLAFLELEKKYTGDKLTVIKKAYHRYFSANIPVKYWELEMNCHYIGDSDLLNEYNNLVSDIALMYERGISVCFAGRYGIGKTFVATNILKRALERGYSGLYLNLGDIVSAMKSGESYLVRKELVTIDFLVVDEFDPRYMGSESASDFYGRTLEDILRNRSQNKLPLILCTNHQDPVRSFAGELRESVSSLWNYVTVIPVLGKDHRPSERLNG